MISSVWGEVGGESERERKRKRCVPAQFTTCQHGFHSRVQDRTTQQQLIHNEQQRPAHTVHILKRDVQYNELNTGKKKNWIPVK